MMEKRLDTIEHGRHKTKEFPKLKKRRETDRSDSNNNN